MTRAISDALKAHLAGDSHTIATCCKIKRKDGTIYGLTDCDIDLAIDLSDGDGSQNYYASRGHLPFSAASSLDGTVQNLNVKGFYHNDGVTKNSLLAGKFQNASILYFVCNYMDLTMGVEKIISGHTGKVSARDYDWEIEFRSLDQMLQEEIGKTFTAGCGADLGDSRCGLSLAAFTFTGTVATVASNSVFTATMTGGATDNYFTLGKLRWTGGANSGLAIEIKDHDYTGGIHTFTLELPMFFAVTINDTFSAYKGCNKSLLACMAFGNVPNFRGFPHIPGRDTVAKFPGQG